MHAQTLFFLNRTIATLCIGYKCNSFWEKVGIIHANFTYIFIKVNNQNGTPVMVELYMAVALKIKTRFCHYPAELRLLVQSFLNLA